MLEGITYAPILYTKNAEITALGHLDSFIRARILPILMCRPGGHNNFYDSVDGFKAATKGMRIAVGVDEGRYGKCQKNPAREQFDLLFEEGGGFRNYYTFIEDWDSAVPVLQDRGGTFANIADQIDNVRNLDRGLVVRILRSNFVSFLEILKAGALQGVECSFVIDAEWSLDVLQAESWMSGIVSELVNQDEHLEIVCASSSFPKDFKDVKSRTVFSIDDRDLFNRIVRRHNQAKLTYGDWGSTRTSEETIANKPRPRIDIPTPRDWIVFRLGDKEEDGFASVARRAQKDRAWLGSPDSWGKRVVEVTALELPGAIQSSHRSNCCRINMHLTIQAMGDTIVDIPEEPFVDNF